MKNTLITANFISLLLFVTVKLSGISTDFSDSLNFLNNSEKEAVTAYFNGSKDYFSLFYYASESVSEAGYETFKNNFYKQVNDFKEQELLDKKPAKVAKTIYKDLHKTYLTKYEYDILFNEIFSTGSYNCLTATALYALCFDKLGLDYDIRLMPEHVYLVLFPTEEAIRVETTNPQQGLLIANNLQKKQYVEFLKDMKLISEHEYNTNSIDELFEKHYNSQEIISLENLVGAQYYNSGLTYLMKEDYRKAFSQFEKGYLFFADERILYMAKATLGSLLILGNLEPLEQVKYLVKYPKYCVTETEKEIPVELFKELTLELLTEQGDPSLYSQLYTYIQSHLKDSLIANEIAYIYNFEIGRYYLRTGNTEKSESYFEEAFVLNPTNLDAQTALVEILQYKMSCKPHEEVFDAAKLLYNRYPHLQENNAFATLYASIALSVASQSFSLNDASKARKYLDWFEEIYDNSMEVNSYLISDTYIAAAVYYFGRGNSSLAKRYINRGLEYSPGNYRLLSLKRSL